MRVATVIALGFCFLMSTSLCNQTWASQSPEVKTSLTDEQVSERLDFLDKKFESEQFDAKLWEYGWGGFNGASTIYSAVQAGVTDNRKDRDMNIVQAVEGLVGVADIVFRRLPAFDADSVCPAPVITREDRLQCLAAKEELARRGAERANEPYEILPHAANLGFNLLAGGIVWALGGGFNRAFMTTVPGEVIGEIQIWTTPGQPSEDYKNYQIRFSPMVQQSNRAKSPTVGLQATLQF